MFDQKKSFQALRYAAAFSMASFNWFSGKNSGIIRVRIDIRQAPDRLFARIDVVSGRLLIVIGIVIVIVGILVTVIPKVPYLGRLPGDILIKKENFVFYFPLATSVIVSIIISLVLYFFTRR